MFTDKESVEALQAMEAAEPLAGGKEALRAGLIELQAAIDSDVAIRVGSNVIGSEVDLSQSCLDFVSTSLIVGTDSRVSNGEDGVFSGNFISNAQVIASSCVIVGSRIIDSVVERVNINNSSITQSTIKRTLHWSPGKSEPFSITNSEVRQYDDEEAATDHRIEIIDGYVQDTSDISTALVDSVNLTAYPDTEGNRVYCYYGNVYKTLKSLPRGVRKVASKI